MTLVRGIALVVISAAAGGAAFTAVYGDRDGLLMTGFMLVCGAAVVLAVELLARARRRAGGLARQLGAGAGVTVGLITLGVGAIALLMFLSPHDAFTMAVLLVFAGALTAYSIWALSRPVMDDINAVRAGLRAVGEGRRDVRIATGADDELADLARSANQMTVQLSEREAERDAAEQARRDLVAAVSHDLRTPLTSLRLLADAIEDDLVDPQTLRADLARMSVHIRSLSALIDDLFELSRIEAGDIQWSMQRVPLADLVGETVEAMRAHAESQGVRVSATVDADLAPARANPERLQRVLFNLIQNAIRHTPADGSVTVAAAANGTTVEVEVADTGAGLAADDRARAFEPFYRGGTGKSRSGDGTGLGLTICRAIVEAHGGRIWFADSARGARVRFSLPKG